MRYLSFLVLSVCVFYSCGDCSVSLENDEKTIQEYISSNNLNAQSTPEGVYYIIDVPGTDEKPNSNSKVTVDYTGYLLNGSEFDGSSEFCTQLWQVIPGWTIGIPQFGKGGSGTIIIPSSLAYDCESRTGIPENSILAFDITLIDFQ